MEMGSGRSLARIGGDELMRLAGLAAEAEAGLFARHPQGAGRYAGRLVCRALCQGRPALPRWQDWRQGLRCGVLLCPARRWPLPVQVAGTADYGPPKFGRYPGDTPSLTARRVDLLGRSLEALPGADPAAVLCGYPSAAWTASARELAAEAVVLISPGPLAGTVIWPPGSSR